MPSVTYAFGSFGEHFSVLQAESWCRLKRRPALMVAGVMISLAPLGLGVLAGMPVRTLGVLSLALLGLVPLMVLFLALVFGPLCLTLLTRSVAKVTRTVTLDEEGVHSHAGTQASHAVWARVTDVAEERRYIFLLFGTHWAGVPRTAFPSPEVAQEFVSFVQSRMGVGHFSGAPRAAPNSVGGTASAYAPPAAPLEPEAPPDEPPPRGPEIRARADLRRKAASSLRMQWLLARHSPGTFLLGNYPVLLALPFGYFHWWLAPIGFVLLQSLFFGLGALQRRQVIKEGGLGCVDFADTFVRVSARGSSNQYEWSAFVRKEETSTEFVLFLTRGYAFIVPKAALERPEEVDEVRRLMSARPTASLQEGR
jgi:hypothetical protein